jgi:hypothetical protein
VPTFSPELSISVRPLKSRACVVCGIAPSPLAL